MNLLSVISVQPDPLQEQHPEQLCHRNVTVMTFHHTLQTSPFWKVKENAPAFLDDKYFNRHQVSVLG